MTDRPRMRPVFEIRLDSDGANVLRALDGFLQSGTSGLAGQVVLPRHAILRSSLRLRR